MYILGIWDGHDSGAAIIKDNKILVAINEERITRKKTIVGFPYNSIKECLNFLNLKAKDINNIAVTTTDFSKTLSRYLPVLKDNYYKIRRRLIKKPLYLKAGRAFKYKLTELGSFKLGNSLTKYYFYKIFNKIGFKNYDLYVVNHHQAHIAGVTFCSGFKKQLCITVDGLGDGLSGTISTFKNKKFERLSNISSKNSLGVFFEQVTYLLGMRELEDEGKVMALSNFSYPISEQKNKLLDLFKVNGLNIESKYSVLKQNDYLQKTSWNIPRESFSYMAQYTLEKKLVELFSNAVEFSDIKNVSWSGGVASNVKANMKIRKESGLKDWFVFPHMGDGGLALGAAMQVNFELNGICNYKFDNIYFGTKYSNKNINSTLKKNNLKFSKTNDISQQVSELISKDKVVFWFQDRMEYGPRALGNRSILTSASKESVKNRLNKLVKKRSWFQPFCPSILESDAKKFIKDYDKADKFMTMGYFAKKNMIPKMKATLNIDDSLRPQIVNKSNNKYFDLLKNVKKNSSYGIVLNTSYNIHGKPIVMTPKDAVVDFKESGADYLAIGDYLVKK